MSTQVIFFGTPDFAVPVLEALKKASFCEIKAVVTQPDRPIGRHHSKPAPSPVKQAAQALNLPVLEGLDGVKEIRADLGVVVAYGEILPKWILDHFPWGIVNIHPSLLPKYRGPSPIQAAILNRDKETGVTLIKLDEEMDHGPIIAQERVSIDHPLTPSWVQEGGQFHGGTPPPLLRRGVGGGPTADELGEKLFQIGAEMLIKYLPDYIAGKIKPVPQDEAKATYTKKLIKKDGQIDWTKSAEEIEAHVRAMNPWPGAWMMWRGKRLIVWRASLEFSLPSRERGRVRVGETASSTPHPTLSSGRRGIVLEEVQLEGKKRMTFDEFRRGHGGFKIQDTRHKIQTRNNIQ